MIIEDLSKITILDGNGEAFDRKRRYFNRYQSTLPHKLRVVTVAVKHKKTVGGYMFDRPVVRCDINYGGSKVRGTFEADFIEEGVFGFPQLIPIETGITLNFDYGETTAYAKAVKKRQENAKQQ